MMIHDDLHVRGCPKNRQEERIPLEKGPPLTGHGTRR